MRSFYCVFFLSSCVLGSSCSFVTRASSTDRREGDIELLLWQRVENFTMPYNSNTCRIWYHTWEKYADKNFQNRSSEVNRWVLKHMHLYSLEPNSLFRLSSSAFMKEMVSGILMIGDSHMNDQYYSLLCLLWSVSKVEGYPKDVRGAKNKWFQVMKFHPDFSPIIYVRWDQFGELNPKHHESQNILKALRFKPSAIVFSTGSHYSSIKFGTSLSAWLNFKRNFKRGLNLMCKKRNPHLSIVWRTPHMHFFRKDLSSKLGGCITATVPSTAPPKAKNDFRHLLRMERYAQGQLQLQCSTTLKAVKILDTFKMSLQRPDAVCGKSKIGRIDCSHFCSPGVVDWWNFEMFQLLSTTLAHSYGSGTS